MQPLNTRSATKPTETIDNRHMLCPERKLRRATLAELLRIIDAAALESAVLTYWISSGHIATSNTHCHPFHCVPRCYPSDASHIPEYPTSGHFVRHPAPLVRAPSPNRGQTTSSTAHLARNFLTSPNRRPSGLRRAPSSAPTRTWPGF